MPNPSPMTSFSALDRPDHLQRLQSETFDLLIIGGGVTGCGIALDAASRSMKTALLEKADFASGTSSKSTKLVHGGLRYLKQFEIGLVRESGTERAILHRLAPHLVRPEKMLLPIVQQGTYGKWAASFGVMVYDLLAGVEKDDRRKMLSKKATLQLEPLLDESTLLGGCLYAEYRTDDARLTIELAKRAVSYGATACNYCTVIDFIYDHEKLAGVKCRDELTGEVFAVKARQVVSAGGPWVDHLRKLDQSVEGKRLHLTKGVHIVIKHEKLPIRHAVYFDVPDGRMVFAIPRGKITYVGTTDTEYKGPLENVTVTQADVRYLLDAVHHGFPAIRLTEKDILSSYAGLRPLIHEEGKSPSELSRKDEIFESPSGLMSIAGGKLTGYRKMAQRIVYRVARRLGRPIPKSTTRHIPLVLDALLNQKAMALYIDLLTRKALQSGLQKYDAWYLATTYGKQANAIFNKMHTLNDSPRQALARAEAWFGVHYEMVQTLADFFVRRTGSLYFDIERIERVRAVVERDLAHYLGWDSERLMAERKRLDQLVYDATHF